MWAIASGNVAVFMKALGKVAHDNAVQTRGEIGTALRAEGIAATRAADLVEAKVAERTAKPRERMGVAEVALEAHQ